MSAERGASPDWQQDRADVAEQRETVQRDRDLERMIRGTRAELVPGSRAYRDEIVAIVRRHNAELVAALGRREILIDHLERMLRAERRAP